MLLRHMLDFSVLLVVIAVAAISLAGWGRLTLRLIQFERSGAAPGTIALWMGFASVIAVLQIIHLVFPINWTVSLLVTAIGFAAFVNIDRLDLQHIVAATGKFTAARPWALLAAAVLAFVAGIYAMGTPHMYDAGLYYFSSIRWHNEYAIVPGLGNLHGRLAFNQSYFGFVAMMNGFPYWNHGHGAAGLLLFLATVATVVQARLQHLRGGLWVLFILGIALTVPVTRLASPAPDYVVSLMQIVIYVLLMKLAVHRDKRDAGVLLCAAAVILLSVTIVTIKLSAAVFGLVALFAVALLAGQPLMSSRTLVLRTGMIAAALGLVYALRGYILSGAPLYPSTIAGMWNLDWAVPIDEARSTAAWIYSWARQPGVAPDQVLGSWDWLGPWMSEFPTRGWVILGSAGVLALADLFLSRFRPSREVVERSAILYLPLLAALVFWFVTAPDYRFLGAIPELLLLLAGWRVVSRFSWQKGLTHGTGGSIWTGPGSRFLRRLSARHGTPEWARSVSFLFTSMLVALVLTDTGTGISRIKKLPHAISGWQPVPSVQTEIRTTDSGLRVRVPVTGDRCWDAPLPCTPYFKPSLHVRGEQHGERDFSSGFRVVETNGDENK